MRTWSRRTGRTCASFWAGNATIRDRRWRPSTAAEPPWKTLRVSQFPTAATAVDLRVHFKCLDGQSQGYILKWLDALSSDPSTDAMAAPTRSRKETRRELQVSGTGGLLIAGPIGVRAW